MEFKFINKKLIDDINDFLNSYDKKNIELEDEDCENSMKRNFVRKVISKLPLFEDKYNKNRDFSDKRKYYVFNHKANMFKTFRIKKFKNFNDENELNWFKKYVKLYGNNNVELPLISKENLLVKCTTTTLENEKDMIANYCDKNATWENFCPNKNDYSKQNIVIFDSSEIDKKFDSQKSNVKFSIRGFVRYDEVGKDNIISFLVDCINKKVVNLTSPEVEFVTTILSIFIKGKEMASEGEYRFIIIGKDPQERELDIEPTLISYKKTNYKHNELHLLKNKYYCKD